MRIAALYDIHGNLPALDAVLAEAAEEQPDAIVVGGDVAAGPMPVETLDRLMALVGLVYVIQGNADRELLDPPSHREIWAERARWAGSMLSPAHRAFLAAPPLLRLSVDELGPTVFCHGSPRSDEEIITTLTPESAVAPMVDGIAEQTIICGHTHVQYDRRVSGVRLVNAGSVGMPFEGAPGARWAMLGPDVSLRCTAYDLDAAIELMRAVGMPGLDELAADLRSPPSGDEASAHFERIARG
jgi:predicted phosphodiesterase